MERLNLPFRAVIGAMLIGSYVTIKALNILFSAKQNLLIPTSRYIESRPFTNHLGLYLVQHKLRTLHSIHKKTAGKHSESSQCFKP